MKTNRLALIRVIKALCVPRTENIFDQFVLQHAFFKSLIFVSWDGVDLFEDFSGAVMRMTSTIFRPVDSFEFSRLFVQFNNCSVGSHSLLRPNFISDT